jgi:ParB/RepB/Spo0J family partition protein
MADQGLLQPIVVRPNKGGGYDMIAGIHRLEAAKKLNWKVINCIVLDDIDADQAELIEIDENLIRAELSPAERAIHIGKRKKLYEKLFSMPLCISLMTSRPLALASIRSASAPPNCRQFQAKYSTRPQLGMARSA